MDDKPDFSQRSLMTWLENVDQDTDALKSRVDELEERQGVYAFFILVSLVINLATAILLAVTVFAN